MKIRILNYRIIVTPDIQTGTGKPGFTAYCPTLGVADDGDTIEEALANIKKAMGIFIESLAEDKQPIPVDNPEHDIVTTAQVKAPNSMKLAA